jgi:hypothetical protein
MSSRALVVAVLGSFVLIVPVASAQILDPLAKCVKEAINARPPRIAKFDQNQKKDITVDIVCSSNSARDLFEVMNKWATTKTGVKRTSNNELAEFRHFGVGSASSQCKRTLEDANGKPIDQYTCWITLDLDQSLMPAIGSFWNQN